MRTKAEIMTTIKESFPGLPDDQCDRMADHLIKKFNEEFPREEQSCKAQTR